MENPTESVTARGQVAERTAITQLINERELFSGSTDELESALEVAYALRKLRVNHTLRQALAQLADNGDATAVLRYLNQE